MGIKKDILIIEDDRDISDAMRIVLESKNFAVRCAYNGKQGLARIQEKAPDLILLDVMMTTDTEGFDLAFKLREDPVFNTIPIVMVTGFPQKMVEKGPEKFQHIMGESWPVAHFFEKPIDHQKLVSTIQTLLQEKDKG